MKPDYRVSLHLTTLVDDDPVVPCRSRICVRPSVRGSEFCIFHLALNGAYWPDDQP